MFIMLDGKSIDVMRVNNLGFLDGSSFISVYITFSVSVSTFFFLKRLDGFYGANS